MGLMKLPDGAFSPSLRKEEQVHMPAGGGGVGEISEGDNRDMFLKSSPPSPRARGLQSSLSGLQDATPGGKTAGVSWQMQEFPEPLVKKPHGEGEGGAVGGRGQWTLASLSLRRCKGPGALMSSTTARSYDDV